MGIFAMVGFGCFLNISLVKCSASSEFLNLGISKLANLHGVEVVKVPQRLCTDNAEMVAWSGILCLQEK